MPVLTPNFLLPVPGPLDSPCDFATQWCDFITATQAVLDTFESVADRTNPVVPLAKMELRNRTLVADNTPVPFDTLTLNNANMVDFDSNNTTITIKRPGRYIMILNVYYATSGVPLNLFVNQLQPTGASTVQRTPAIGMELDMGVAGTGIGCVLTGVLYVTSPPVNASTIVEVLVGSTMTINSAALSLFWFADGATP